MLSRALSLLLTAPLLLSHYSLAALSKAALLPFSSQDGNPHY